MFTAGKAATMFLLSISLIVFNFLTFFWASDMRSQSNACYGSNASINAIVDVYHSLAKTSYQLSLAALILTLMSSLYFIMSGHPEIFRFFESGFISRAIGFLSATGSIVTHLFLVALICFNVLDATRASYHKIAPGGTCSFSKVDQLIAFEWTSFVLVVCIVVFGHWFATRKHDRDHHHSMPVAQESGRYVNMR